jgi:hypothetical protein
MLDFTDRFLVPVDFVLVVYWILGAFNDAFQMQKLCPVRSWEYSGTSVHELNSFVNRNVRKPKLS